MKPEVMEDIEGFTCLMYGYARQSSVDAVRGLMLDKMIGDDETLNSRSKVDFSRLPPCRSNLIPHVQRVNHRVALYKRADQPNFFTPKPFEAEQGWEKNDDGLLEPVWSCGPILPMSLIDILEQTLVSNGDSDDETEDGIDFEECCD